MSSHNSKYYVKKLTKTDGSKCMKLENFGFKKKFLVEDQEVTMLISLQQKQQNCMIVLKLEVMKMKPSVVAQNFSKKVLRNKNVQVLRALV
jgi:hypothetical protein